MKKWIILILLLPFINAFSAVTITNQNMPATDSGKTIMVTANQPQFTLFLNSNPSTGYSWFIEDYPSNLVESINSYYVSQDTKRMGAGGMQKWTFNLKPAAFDAPRKLVFKFIYARKWDINNTAKEEVFYVATSGERS